MTMVSLLVKMLANLQVLLGAKLEKITIACTNWRLVDGKKKYELWTNHYQKNSYRMRPINCWTIYQQRFKT
jgi:hypothetical protein